MKSKLLAQSAAIVLAGVTFGPAYAQDNPAVTDTPAGTKLNPQPSVQEDLVYLKDIVALQTLRLDEAEELISKQNALIEAQARQIQALTANVVAIGQAQSVNVAGFGGSYEVKSGDTLTAIARRNDTTVAALARENNLRAPYPLRVGATLKIPGTPPPVLVAAAPAPAAPVAAPTPAPQQTAQATQTGTAEKVQQTPAAQSQQPAPTRTAAGPQPERSIDQANRVASAANENSNENTQSGGLPTEVGVRDENENERPYLALFSDIGGILTPKGSLFVEPSIDYTVTSDNRFFFQGIEIVDAVLIGAIEATDTDRQALSESISLRYGITNRLEIDGRIAHVSRQDRVAGVAIDDSTTSVRNLGGYGFSDAEMGIHYQLNNGGKWPYAIANLRVKAPTGNGPFDVDRNPDTGIETELAVGSGFWTVEPSMTFILASDPASLYANIGYQMNMSTSPNEILTNQVDEDTDTILLRSTLVDFDPGDALRTSIGVGLSLNEKLSMNFGYDQSYFFNSQNTFEIITSEQVFELNLDGTLALDTGGNPIPILDGAGNNTYEAAVTAFRNTRTPSVAVGSFLFGGSYAVNNRLRINLNGAIGATAEAPDARISLRASYRLFD